MDDRLFGSAVTIRLVAGDTAPRYEGQGGAELKCEEVVITEQGTKESLPIVDFVMRGPDGQLYLLVMTGRIVNMIASALRGVNMRNHGIAEP